MVVGAALSEEALAVRLLCQGTSDLRSRLGVAKLALTLQTTGAFEVVLALLTFLFGSLASGSFAQRHDASVSGRASLARRPVALAWRVIVMMLAREPVSRLAKVTVAARGCRANPTLQIRMRIDEVRKELLRALNVNAEFLRKFRAQKRGASGWSDVEMECVTVHAALFDALTIDKSAATAVTD